MTHLDPQRIANIPHELRERSQWVNWRYETEGDRQTKKPLSPHTGYVCNAQDAANQSDFDTAFSNAIQHGCGIGFVLTQDDPFSCIDLDDPFKGLEPGTEAWTQAEAQRANQHVLVSHADSYTELSPSGNGAHIWVRGSVPTGLRSGKTEIYSAARFMTVTGNAISPTGYRIIDAQPLLDNLYQSIRPSERGDDTGYDEPQKMDDAELIRRVEMKDEYAALATGDRTLWEQANRSNDKSASDQALMNRVAAISRNREQTKRVFLSSPLAAEISRKTNPNDYVRRTLSRAFDSIRPLANVNSEAIRQSADAASAGAQGAQAADTPLAMTEQAQAPASPYSVLGDSELSFNADSIASEQYRIYGVLRKRVVSTV